MRLAGGLATLVLASTLLEAKAADDLQAREDEGLAGTCAACHGTAGDAVQGATIPGLAGRNAPDMTEQMLSFRSGRRPGTVMPQLARGYSDAQIERLARYFASQTGSASR